MARDHVRDRRALVAGTTKGSPIETAKVAGMIGVKKTPDLLPHCHPLRVTGAEIVVEPNGAEGRIHVVTTRSSLRSHRGRDGGAHRLHRRGASRCTTRRKRSTARPGSTGSACSRSPAGSPATTAPPADARPNGEPTRDVNESHRCAFRALDVVLRSRPSPDVVSLPGATGRRLGRGVDAPRRVRHHVGRLLGPPRPETVRGPVGDRFRTEDGALGER
jgi:hypothetical protein